MSRRTGRKRIALSDRKIESPSPPKPETASSLREARKAAGISVRSLAQRVGAVTPGGRELVSAWERGVRPSWRFIEPLATDLAMPVNDLLRVAWHEAPGDACECGCGGRKVLPEDPRARKLWVAITCQRCGEERVRRKGKKGVHFPLCPPCSNKARGDVIAPAKCFRCAGYDDHRVLRHARRCIREVEYKPFQIRSYLAKQTRKRGSRPTRRPQPEFLDEAAGTFRCRYCAAAGETVARLERVLHDSTGKRIRTRTARRNAMRSLVVGEDLDRVPAWKDLSPGFAQAVKSGEGQAKAIEVRRERPMSDNAREAHRRAMILSRWTPPGGAEGIVVGVCLLCDKMVFGARSTPGYLAEWHGRCLAEWRKTRDMRYWVSQCRAGHREPMPLPLRRRGRPSNRALMKRNFRFAVLHRLDAERWSLRRLAAEAVIDVKSVDEAIKWISKHLPSEEIVPTRFVPYIGLLSRELVRRI